MQIALTAIRFYLDADGHPLNPRGRVTDTTDLQLSMAQVGQQTPIRVVEASDGTYFVLGGHRRVTAARALGWDFISADVVEAPDDIGGADLLAAMIADNVREDIPPSALGATMARMMQDTSWTIERVAALCGLKPDRAKLYLSLSEAPDSLRKRIDRGEISISAWERLRDKPREVQDQVAAMDNPTVQAVKRLLYKPRPSAPVDEDSDEVGDDVPVLSGVFGVTFADLDTDSAVFPLVKSAVFQVMLAWDELSPSEQTRIRTEAARLIAFVENGEQEAAHA